MSNGHGIHEHAEFVLRLRDEQKKSWDYIVGAYNEEFSANVASINLRKWYSRHQRKNNGEELAAKPENTVQFIEKVAEKVKEDPNVDEIMQGFIDSQSFRGKFSIKSLVAQKSIGTQLPIGLSFISDVHLGSPYTHYEAFWADCQTIKNHPRMFMVKGGDWPDKFMPQFKDKRAIAGQLHPAQVQILSIEKIMEYLKEKIVCAVAGNHDDMDAKQTGVSSEYFIHRDMPFPYLPHGGMIELTVGDILYKIIIKHKYRFNSQLNQFNVHHRMLEILNPTADIVVTEHEHNPGVESIEKFDFDQKRTIVNIRTGSYKIDDPFSLELFKAGRRGPQTIVLWPKKKKITAFHGEDALQDAITFMKGLEDG